MLRLAAVVIRWLASVGRSRRELLLENIALRQQLATMFQKNRPRGDGTALASSATGRPRNGTPPCGSAAASPPAPRATVTRWGLRRTGPSGRGDGTAIASSATGRQRTGTHPCRSGAASPPSRR